MRGSQLTVFLWRHFVDVRRDVVADREQPLRDEQRHLATWQRQLLVGLAAAVVLVVRLHGPAVGVLKWV